MPKAKRYTGSAWEERPVRKRDAAAWDNVVGVRYYDGTQWVTGSGTNPPPAGTYSFEGSSLWAAGFQNTVAVAPSPHTANMVLIGGDTAGLHRSVDGGENWDLTNESATILGQLKVASVRWHPVTAGKCYAYLTNDSNSWLGVSTDYGQTWTYRAMPAGTGSETGGDAHPRHTGQMIAVKGADVIVVTKAGVRRTSDDGASWSTVGLTTSTCTGVDVDPNASTFDIYVTADSTNAGLYRITGAGAGESPVITELGALTDPQEVVCVNEGGTTVAYVAGGTAGVFKSVAGAAPSDITGTLPNTSSVWTAVDAVRSGGVTIVYVGAVNPETVSGGYTGCIYKSSNGGTSWTWVTSSATQVKLTNWNGAGPVWWLSNELPSLMLGKGGYDFGQISIDRQNVNNVVVAGRSGVWHTADAGTTWYPAVKGMGASVGRLPAVDPSNVARVAFADVDWDLVTSTDKFVSQPTKPAVGQNYGMSLHFTSAGKLFIGFGDRDDTPAPDGHLRSNTTPFAGGTWVNESRGTNTGWPAAPARCMGVYAADDGSFVLAAIEGQGLYRRTGTAWVEVSTVVASTSSSKAQIDFHANGSTIWVYDPTRGLFRSTDSGVNWTASPIWAKVTGTTRHAGHLKGVGNNLILSTASEVYVIHNAHDGTLNADGTTATGTISATRLAASTLTKPGPITISPAGDVYVTMVQGSTALYRARGPISGFTSSTVFTNLANDDYRRACGFPLGIAVGSDETIYLSLDGNGHYVGRLT